MSDDYEKLYLLQALMQQKIITAKVIWSQLGLNQYDFEALTVKLWMR